MFDISFSELMVIAVVALIVIGPEKLPKVARTAGAFFGRMQRFVAQVKDEVNREARFEELQNLQDEVKSSLQQEVDAISRSIAPPTLLEGSTFADTEVVARKPRKRREAKSAGGQLISDIGVDSSATAKPARIHKSAIAKTAAHANSPDLFEGHAAEQSVDESVVTRKLPRRKKTSMNTSSTKS
ncbi:Sec-independent protein translocase protein TatB [Methylophilus aquaticus]|uniref:Sec-independent protein translocase protein TatB n=1 Tax=Methylophilus aquaticus TaxID=1971610 RepID=A0ABT9JWJ0_9PROT|nr:Sec-independent protein translocase protein TatB [Methylophilus aquaticus]MDP8568839.1 Sec-independent protein translocase protein TatB [Methylophilus aquaticus]